MKLQLFSVSIGILGLADVAYSTTSPIAFPTSSQLSPSTKRSGRCPARSSASGASINTFTSTGATTLIDFSSTIIQDTTSSSATISSILSISTSTLTTQPVTLSTSSAIAESSLTSGSTLSIAPTTSAAAASTSTDTSSAAPASTTLSVVSTSAAAASTTTDTSDAEPRPTTLSIVPISSTAAAASSTYTSSAEPTITSLSVPSTTTAAASSSTTTSATSLAPITGPIPSCLPGSSFFLRYISPNYPRGAFVGLVELSNPTEYFAQPTSQLADAVQFELDQNGYLVYQADQAYYFSITNGVSQGPMYFQDQDTLNNYPETAVSCSVSYDPTVNGDFLSCQFNSLNTFEYCGQRSPATSFGSGSDSGCDNIELQVLYCLEL